MVNFGRSYIIMMSKFIKVYATDPWIKTISYQNNVSVETSSLVVLLIKNICDVKS